MHRESELQNIAQANSLVFLADEESEPVVKSAVSDLASLFESSEAEETISFEHVDRTELIRLQQSDSSLTTLFELAKKGDKRYLVKSGVLLRFWRDKIDLSESCIHQIVFPATLRPKLLQFAHEIPAAGHLGVAKTQSRLLRHFLA